MIFFPISKRSVFLPVDILKITFKSYYKNVLTLKTNKLKYISVPLFILLVLACSTKKDKFINREFQALNTKYNVLYNGNIALDKGIAELKLKYKDNFWEILPIERMQISKENILPGQQTKNPNFDRAEEKATKAIQKRSMNIDGKEKNPQMDEAHLLLGKSRYYDQRFVPALEAFNYILYKYPESDKIYEAKIWRERTNMRMENDALAVKNLRKLLMEIKFKDQVFADANATLAQAFLNLDQKDSAVVRLKRATEFTKSDEEKARYSFILGQLYEQAGKKDSAYATFQSIIDMKRKSPRRYIIQAHARQAAQFDFEKGDTLAFMEKYNDLLKDRENRPFLDVLNHQVALFYDKQNNDKQAAKYYNKSLRTKSEDQYLMASNYRNLADINFDNAKYQTAGQYYDSTLVRLQPRTREHRYIQKKRENLDDVIKFEGIAQRNDSILNVMSLSETDRKGFYEDYIEKLKKEDIAKAKIEKEKQEKLERQSASTDNGEIEVDGGGKTNGNAPPSIKPSTPPSGASAKANGTFYFYTPSTVAYGKLEFKKRWGSRTLKNNWRLSSLAKSGDDQKEETNSPADSLDVKKDEKKVEEKYTAEFYLKQLPKSQKVLDSLAKERNFAYYQLGVIYKEKFKENKLAIAKLEQLLKNNPEERLILPAMYNLFKIYEITDKDKAAAMKERIISQYPESRYAQILKNPNDAQNSMNLSPEITYQNLFKIYEEGDYRKVLADLEQAIDQFAGEEIIPKMELLKAATIGKLQGLAEYKKALNFVALNYPNSQEGKAAELLLSTDIPVLERLKFYQAKPESWKIIFKVADVSTPDTKKLLDKIKKFTSERTADKLKTSVDVYTMTENFIVMHGIGSEQRAKDILTILQDYKDYKIKEEAVIISNENYTIVQIKKNLAEYLVTPATEPLPEVPAPAPMAPSKTNEKGNNRKVDPKEQPVRTPKGNVLSPPGANNAERMKVRDSIRNNAKAPQFVPKKP